MKSRVDHEVWRVDQLTMNVGDDVEMEKMTPGRRSEWRNAARGPALVNEGSVSV